MANADACPFCRPSLSSLASWTGERYLVIPTGSPDQGRSCDAYRVFSGRCG